MSLVVVEVIQCLWFWWVEGVEWWGDKDDLGIGFNFLVNIVINNIIIY